MDRRLLAAVACCALALGIASPPALAASASASTCVATATWSLTTTSATVSYDPHSCYIIAAATGTSSVPPDWSVDGDLQSFPSASTTYSYAPVVGLCDGTLSQSTSSSSTTGVLTNQGPLHTSVTLAVTGRSAPGAAVIQHVGVAQPSCSSSFRTTVVAELASASP